MLTTYFLKIIGEDIFKHQEMQQIPFDYYIGFSSTVPNIDGSGVTEPLENTGYSRALIENNENTFDVTDDNGLVTNYNIIYFPESKLPWENLIYYVVYDSLTDGNLLAFGKLNQTITVPIKTVISIPVSALSLKVSNG